MKSTLRALITRCCLACTIQLLIWTSAASFGSTFSISETDFLLDGRPYLIRCGEMHFARIPREYWQHRLRMARAMGLNTVCAYLFWNVHEPTPGRFNFKGNADVGEFCRLAQAEGLKVILRPGPYSCAEWDFGGFPFWLLKTPDIKVRTQDPRYLQACQRYLQAVGKELAPLQISRGGPILMVQVENEYGSYGHDRQYIGLVRDYLKVAGFEVPLFTCDGPVQLKNDTRDDLFCVVNFGDGPEGNFKALREIRPNGPLMCGEYYPGWFDSWGKPHHTGNTANIVKEIGWMLEHNASFSIYMVHGGTSFGFSAGANCPPFSPQVTSYDYDAPISEAGWDTPKFHALRELFLQHLAPAETLPPVPGRKPVIQIEAMEFEQMAPLLANLPPAKSAQRPQPMELYDQPHGCILYRTRLPAGGPATLKITELHDYGLVLLDGKRIATLDRRRNQNSTPLPSRDKDATLDLLVDTFGHVNYGSYIHDRKGITEKVELVSGDLTKELTGWDVFNLPFDPQNLSRLKFRAQSSDLPAFYRTTFSLAVTGDTFLDFSTWGKGIAWVNGHNLGRFWSIGPHQTLYCPGPWLKKGRNELIVFDLNGTSRHTVAGLAEPILNEAREVANVKKHRRPGESLVLDSIHPVASGSFAPGKEWQTVRFPATKGRYFCLDALNSQSGDAFTTCSELFLLGSEGKDLPRDNWKVIYADSEEVDADDNRADNLFDLQFSTFWHTQWEGAQPTHPHEVVLDLGAEQTVPDCGTSPARIPPMAGSRITGSTCVRRSSAACADRPIPTRPTPPIAFNPQRLPSPMHPGRVVGLARPSRVSQVEFAQDLRDSARRNGFNQASQIGTKKMKPFEIVRVSRWVLVLALMTGASGSRVAAAIAPLGFTALFNGTDLAGWRGGDTFDHRKLLAMSPAERDAQIAKWTATMKGHWTVQDGELVNDGQGAYASTEKDYGDFELLVEYTTVAKADSGIYLRGCPQVQIWDYTEQEKFSLGADKGSGGLWNNSPGAPGKDPLVLADKPFGEWNAVRVIMVGARVSVWLNEKLVVDHALLENYYDRKTPIPPKGPIQLQTHGGEIRWRNVFIREIGSEEADKLLASHGNDGFKSIFNGMDFTGWAGPTNEYEIVRGAIRCQPKKGGTIYTTDEYGDFAARLEIKLPPGGNNGLAIRYPGQGDTAYNGMCELQVLDDNYEKATGDKIDPRQAHGSAYGMVAAARGYQHPIGEWNFEQVTVQGSKIKVELNGTVILDCDLSTVTEFMANSKHPGKDRTKGYFGFAGHNDPVAFRNITIKTL